MSGVPQAAVILTYVAAQVIPQLVGFYYRRQFQSRQEEFMRESETAHRERMEWARAEHAADQAELREDRVKSEQRFEELSAARASRHEEWESKQEQYQTEHDEKIENFQKENMKELEKYRAIFEDKCRNEKEEHEKRMTSKSEKNNKELAEMMKTLESARKKGEEEIEAAKILLGQVIQEMKDTASQQNQEMFQLLEKYRKESDELRKKNRELSKKVAKEQMKQLKEEHELKHQEVVEEKVILQSQLKRNAMEDMAKRFQIVVKSFDPVVDAVEKMEVSYTAAKYDPSTIQKGALDCHKATVRQAEKRLQAEGFSIRQSLITSADVPAKFQQFLNDSLTEIEKCIKQARLSSVLELIVLAYDSKDLNMMDSQMPILLKFEESFDGLKTEMNRKILEYQNQFMESIEKPKLSEALTD